LISDFEKAVNADVPNYLDIVIKQEEFELVESYQHHKNLDLTGSGSLKNKNNNKSLIKKVALKVRQEVHERENQDQSGISSK
jgi:hypothetical protein